MNSSSSLSLACCLQLLVAKDDFDGWRERQAAHHVQPRDVRAGFVRMPQPNPEDTGFAFHNEQGIALDDWRWINDAALFQCVEQVWQMLTKFFAFQGDAIFDNLFGGR